MLRLKTAAYHLLWLAVYLICTLLGLTATYLLVRYLFVPILLFFHPALDPLVFDIGIYGFFPQRHYKSFPLSSPDARLIRWDPEVCEGENEYGGLVTLDFHGPGVFSTGPAILDLKGNLVWRNNSYGDYAMNVKVQVWNSESYLTFWAGQNEKGNFYMLDSGFNLVRNVSAVGHGIYGDPHEFRITPEGTALIIVYNHTVFDVTGTTLPVSKPKAIDGVVQELDLETGNLLFEWRASDHLRPEDGEYVRRTFEAHAESKSNWIFSPRGPPLDYYHFNSVDKDSEGNYYLSIRYTHQVICISGKTGEILWGLGGDSTDFEDLSDGKASSFQWQHDAKWIDEEQGLFGLFDNGIMHGHRNTAPRSQGMIIHLDTSNRTVTHLHSFPSSNNIRSLTQGSFQRSSTVARASALGYEPPQRADADLAFIGWGSAAAYTLHDVNTEETLCETHFGPSVFFSLGIAQSYRAYRTPKSWLPRPQFWDPGAVVNGNQVFVSWNGGVEVRHWVLQKGTTAGDDAETDWTWEDVADVERSGFESVIDMPDSTAGDASAIYRVAALDSDKNLLRYSNVFRPEISGYWTRFWLLFVVGVLVAILIGYSLRRRKHSLLWLKARLRPSRVSSGNRGLYSKLDDGRGRDLELDDR